ncbi:MAG TPA: hypothetical protein VGH39_17190 [Xanthobacteraceae bacterium]|jgi:hypothetical protein
MAVLLLILGIVVAASGVAAIGFGIPLVEFSVGAALLSGGATALTGGLILIGLSAVVTELSRLAGGMTHGTFAPRGDQAFEPTAPSFPATPLPPPVSVSSPRAPVPGSPSPPRARPEAGAREARPPLMQPSPSSVDVSAAAIERLRSTIPRAEGPRAEPVAPGPAEETPLSPNGPAQYAPAARSRPEAPPPEPDVSAEDRSGAAVETLKTSRLDFLFRSKSARSDPAIQNFETMWPADARSAKSTPPQPQVVQPPPQPAESQPSPASPPAPEPAGAQAPPGASVLKSGVVDGMAYTLYSDGSIEAKLPEGTVRFGSVAELRAHIESGA